MAFMSDDPKINGLTIKHNNWCLQIIYIAKVAVQKINTKLVNMKNTNYYSITFKISSRSKPCEPNISCDTYHSYDRVV